MFIFVIGRDIYKPIANPDDWGEDTVICDPWADKVFPASEFRAHLKDYRYDKKKAWNYIEELVEGTDFKNNKKLYPLSASLTTRELTRKQHLDNLMKELSVRNQILLSIIEQYVIFLRKLRDQLISNNDVNKAKIKILNKKIKEIDHVMKSCRSKMVRHTKINYETLFSERNLEVNMLKSKLGFSQRYKNKLETSSNFFKKMFKIKDKNFNRIDDYENKLQISAYKLKY